MPAVASPAAPATRADSTCQRFHHGSFSTGAAAVASPPGLCIDDAHPVPVAVNRNVESLHGCLGGWDALRVGVPIAQFRDDEVDPIRYHQRLKELIDRPETLALHLLLVRQLEWIREGRRLRLSNPVAQDGRHGVRKEAG
jgi:hypothetical protein